MKIKFLIEIWWKLSFNASRVPKMLAASLLCEILFLISTLFKKFLLENLKILLTNSAYVYSVL